MDPTRLPQGPSPLLPLARIDPYASYAVAVPPPIPHDSASDLETDGLLDYLRILLSNSRTLLLATGLGTLAAILVTLPLAPVFRARTTIEIQGVNNEFLNTKQVNPVSDDGSNSNVMADIQTQIKIINSEFLVDRVVDELKKEGKFPVVAPRNEPSRLQRLFHLKAGPPVDIAEQFRHTALKNLTVSQMSQTRVIEVYFKASSPQLAADFVNLLGAQYIESTMEARLKMSEQTGQWLGHQVDDIRQKLERSELNLQQYARKAGLLFTSAQSGSPDRANVSDEKLRQMQEQLSTAQNVRALAQSRYETAKAAPPETLPDVMNDQALRDLQKQITDLHRQEAELNSLYTPKNEKVQRVEVQLAPLLAAFEDQRNAILHRIQNEYEIALRHERLLKSDYDAQASLILDQADKSIQYNILKRDVDTNRQLYESMLQQIKASTVASALRASNIRIVDPGKVSETPYSPNIKINAGLGFIAGLVFGAAFVLVRKSTDRTFNDPSDMQLWTKLSELGVIPSQSRIDDFSFSGKVKPINFPVPLPSQWRKRVPSSSLEVALWQPKQSRLAEAFSTVLTSVLFSGANGERPRVLVFTSANAAEGKTTVTSNLGRALAQIRQRVLIIDADLRKPRMHQIFNLKNERGLSTLLTEELLEPDAADGYVQETKYPGVSVLTSGPPTSAAANLLHSPNLRNILDRFRAQFDMILIDTPPAMQLTDSRIVGRLADGVILVARAGQTSRDSVLSVVNRFREDRICLLGSILNDWTPKRSANKFPYYTSESQTPSDTFVTPL